jgi:K+ potassium transporter
MGPPRLATGSDQRHAAAPPSSRRHRPAAEAKPSGRRLMVLSLTALGVVYGDIGTSPLYAFRGRPLGLASAAGRWRRDDGGAAACR